MKPQSDLLLMITERLTLSVYTDLVVLFRSVQMLTVNVPQTSAFTRYQGCEGGNFLTKNLMLMFGIYNTVFQN